MFKVGDVVLYGTEGACEIVEIGKRDLGAGPREYYILQPVYRKEAVVFVPADVEKLVGRMRRVLTAEEIDDIIREMPGEGFLWVENEAERKIRYKELLAEGDSRMLVRMIKTLYLHQKEQGEKGRKLHMADERAFKEAERLLYDQFALALNIRPEEVLPYIIRRIEGIQKL
ncbi:MAG: CarD family transcriptional regulator [Oscillospiraceae bacterium]|nr:CarD family transcriptional regulator [Oscillospiraceae bacterium]